MLFLADWFVEFFYRPFLNLLVGIYWLLEQGLGSRADMGLAVICFTVAFRILWLPISLASGRSEKERREVEETIKQLKVKHRQNPAAEKQAIKILLSSNKRLLVASIINISLQVLIALMLYRIFSTGLKGADFHLLYPFLPQPQEALNLTFLGKFDLTRPSLLLNLIQSAFILAVEVLSHLTSPFPATRRDVTTTFALPVISFLIFASLPAGKKLFIITTLAFSLLLMLVKQVVFVYHSISKRFDAYSLEKAGIKVADGQKTSS